MSKKIAPRRKVDLGLLHLILGNSSNRSLMEVDTADVGKILNLRYIQTPFAHHVRYLQLIKRKGQKIQWNQRHLSNGFYVHYSRNIPKRFDRWSYFYNHLLIVYSYSKIANIYVMERITDKKVMDKLDMFLARFRKIDKFGWWDRQRISADASTQYTYIEF